MRDRRRRRLVLGVVIVVGGLIVNFREKLRGDPAAALRQTYLGVIYRSAERVLGGRGWIGASFPCEVNQHGGAGLRILGAVNPGIGAAFSDDFSRFQRNGRIVSAIEPLRTL